MQHLATDFLDRLHPPGCRLQLASELDGFISDTLQESFLLSAPFGDAPSLKFFLVIAITIDILACNLHHDIFPFKRISHSAVSLRLANSVTKRDTAAPRVSTNHLVLSL